MHIDPTDPIRGVPEPTAANGKGSRPPDVSRDALLGSGVPAEVVDAVWRQEAERLRLRQEKLERIRKELQSGTYRRPTQQVAERLVEFFREGEAAGKEDAEGDAGLRED